MVANTTTLLRGITMSDKYTDCGRSRALVDSICDDCTLKQHGRMLPFMKAPYKSIMLSIPTSMDDDKYKIIKDSIERTERDYDLSEYKEPQVAIPMSRSPAGDLNGIPVRVFWVKKGADDPNFQGMFTHLAMVYKKSTILAFAEDKPIIRLN